jgi:hypothetical protein
MLAWALYALAYAGPAMEPLATTATAPRAGDAPLLERRTLPSVDLVYVLAATVLAVMFQLPGWTPSDPGRALLTRLVGIASGLAVVSAATELAAKRNAVVPPKPRRRRRKVDPRMAMGAIVAVALLLAWAIALYPGAAEGPHP